MIRETQFINILFNNASAGRRQQNIPVFGNTWMQYRAMPLNILKLIIIYV